MKNNEYDFITVKMLCAAAGIHDYDNCIIINKQFHILINHAPAYVRKNDGYFVFIKNQNNEENAEGKYVVDAGGHGWQKTTNFIHFNQQTEPVFLFRMLPDWKSGLYYGKTIIAAECPIGTVLYLLFHCQKHPYIASNLQENIQIFHEGKGCYTGMEFMVSGKMDKIRLAERVWDIEENDARKTVYKTTDSNIFIPNHSRLKRIYRLCPDGNEMVYFIVPYDAETDDFFEYALLEGGRSCEGIEYQKQKMQYRTVNWIG